MKEKRLAIILAVLMISALLTAAAYADDGADFGTGMHWSYAAATNTLQITGSGVIDNYDTADSVPWNAYNASITQVSIADTVTSIGSNAFAGTQITSITVPKAVTSIGSNAFPAGLTEITASCKLESSLPTVTTIHLTHDASEIAKADATFTDPGTEKHWKCNDCGKLFTDSACTTETTAAALVIPKKDNEAPVLTNVYPDRSTVSLPTSVIVTVLADDNNMSGVSSGSITFTNPGANGSPSVLCSLALDGNALTGVVSFGETASSGEYYISSLTLVDKAKNSRTYTYSSLDTAFKNVKIKVVRTTTATAIATLTMNATSVGYGGVVTGTITVKDTNGYALPNKSFDIYVSNVKSGITATTDENGTATFNYSNTVPGVYTLKASFIGDNDYYPCETNSVDVTFTTVPSTGDSYDVALWCCVAVLALGVNAWFVIRRKKA